jgi:hypothetical protein
MMMSGAEIALWLFVINLGVAFGAGLYEHRIVVPRWVASSAQGTHWRPEVARDDDVGRRFWGFVSTMPLTLLTLANLFLAWRGNGPMRAWWLAAALVALAERLLTFFYFIPTMVRLMKAADSHESAAAAVRWANVNYLRHALVLLAWVLALETFALFYQVTGRPPAS